MSHSFASLNALLQIDVDKELLECIALETSSSNPEDNPFKSVYESRERLTRLRDAVFHICGFVKKTRAASGTAPADPPLPSKPSLLSVADAPLNSFAGQPVWGLRALGMMDVAISKLQIRLPKTSPISLLPIASASPAASCPCDQQLQLQHLDAVLDSRLGSNFVQAEELSEGERMLTRAAQLLRGCGASFLLERVRVLNSVGIVWSGRGEHEKARVHLEEAHAIFSNALEQGSADVGELAEAHTMSCFYLAQVFGHLGQVALSAAMCQVTLRRQCLMPNLDRREWAMNAVQLSGYFLTQDDWVNSHRCLAAAEIVLSEGMRLLGMPQTPADDGDDEYSARGRMRQASANIGWGWGKLYKSKLESVRSSDGSRAVTPVEFPSVLSSQPDAHARALEVAHFSYDTACEFIKKGLAGFSRAHAHYVLDGFVTDHCTIAHDISGMYRALCYFTNDDATKCKLHKRRMDLIVPLANALNPTAFCDMYRVLCAPLCLPQRTIVAISYSTCIPTPLVNTLA
jgi:hypothetical protein